MSVLDDLVPRVVAPSSLALHSAVELSGSAPSLVLPPRQVAPLLDSRSLTRASVQ